MVRVIIRVVGMRLISRIFMVFSGVRVTGATLLVRIRLFDVVSLLFLFCFLNRRRMVSLSWKLSLVCGIVVITLMCCSCLI